MRPDTREILLNERIPVSGPRRREILANYATVLPELEKVMDFKTVDGAPRRTKTKDLMDLLLKDDPKNSMVVIRVTTVKAGT